MSILSGDEVRAQQKHNPEFQKYLNKVDESFNMIHTIQRERIRSIMGIDDNISLQLRTLRSNNNFTIEKLKNLISYKNDDAFIELFMFDYKAAAADRKANEENDIETPVIVKTYTVKKSIKQIKKMFETAAYNDFMFVTLELITRIKY